MHIFRILGTYCQEALQKKWPNLDPNPALDESGFYGIVFPCSCDLVIAAISAFSQKQGSWPGILGTQG